MKYCVNFFKKIMFNKIITCYYYLEKYIVLYNGNIFKFKPNFYFCGL